MLWPKLLQSYGSQMPVTGVRGSTRDFLLPRQTKMALGERLSHRIEPLWIELFLSSQSVPHVHSSWRSFPVPTTLIVHVSASGSPSESASRTGIVSGLQSKSYSSSTRSVAPGCTRGSRSSQSNPPCSIDRSPSPSASGTLRHSTNSTMYGLES